jgi:hypothetical protein
MLVIALLVLSVCLVLALLSAAWSVVIVSGGFLLYGLARLRGPHRTPTAHRR